MITTSYARSLGWGFQGERSGIRTFFFHVVEKGEIFQMTVSDEYVKILLKGLTKSKNLTIFKGIIEKESELKQIMLKNDIK